MPSSRDTHLSPLHLVCMAPVQVMVFSWAPTFSDEAGNPVPSLSPDCQEAVREKDLQPHMKGRAPASHPRSGTDLPQQALGWGRGTMDTPGT